ncbi:MAG: hypothetical protein ACXW2Y_09415 [Acidimicrobiia bacterium]
MARKTTKMSAQHKAALAEGRAHGRAVREYLDALEESRPKRGRKRTPDSVRKRLAAVETALPEATGVKRVQLLQERRDLRSELDTFGTTVDLSSVEKAFLKAAKPYSENKGISYATWREAGVPADVLKKAGITRAS